MIDHNSLCRMNRPFVLFLAGDEFGRNFATVGSQAQSMRWLIVVVGFLFVTLSAQAQYPWGYAPYIPGYQSYPPMHPGYTSGHTPGPTSLARAMVDAHNAIRVQVGVPPLVWSPQLAAVAQNWANTLIASHSFNHSGGRYGENLYTISGGFASPGEVITRWAEEMRGYNVTNNSCVGVCGHYTQIVWRTTRGVGCAVATEPGREVWVCEYDPPGNIVGQRPY